MTGSITINEVTVTLRAPQHPIATTAPPPVTCTCPRNNAIRDVAGKPLNRMRLRTTLTTQGNPLNQTGATAS